MHFDVDCLLSIPSRKLTFLSDLSFKSWIRVCQTFVGDVKFYTNLADSW